MSRLNTPPACAPVNASLPALRLRAHDSGPVWLARPSPYGSFIHTSTPVYPGAPMITNSNSFRRERDAQSLGRFSTSHHSHFRAVPCTNRILPTLTTHSHSPTSSTNELPACALLLPRQCFVPTHRQTNIRGTTSGGQNQSSPSQSAEDPENYLAGAIPHREAAK
jgi:hypothetical protein